MRCTRVEHLVERFIDDRLPQGLAARVMEHLRGCERCRRRIEAARTLDRALRTATPARAPAALRPRVMAAVYREEAERREGRLRGRDSTPLYRRLGYSFIATAAVLAASLLIPHLAYPKLLQSDLLAANLSNGRPAAVARLVGDAGQRFGAVIGQESESHER